MNQNYPDTPSADFLYELVERAKRYGWTGDYLEITYFIKHLFDQTDLIMPTSMTPYEEKE